MDFVKLTKDKLSVEAVYGMVGSPEFGAVSLFVGTTRNNFDGKKVVKLEYEAYEGMAVKALEKICKNVREKFNVGNIAIFHRLGDVPVQEASVVIAMSAPHRKEVLEAIPFAVDALKADVPIWKKEIYEGDSAQWKENPECAWSTQEVTSVQANPSESVDFYEEIVEADPVDTVPPDLIQINANLQEINRRINSFINIKRQQVNISNIHDFCLDEMGNEKESTCARVDAILIKRKDSKSHLKIHRVENIVGPQTQPYEFEALDLKQPVHNCPPGAEERLNNAENYLGINKSSLDVFQRLKAIEDKILYLESVSPEYFDYVRQEKQVKSNLPTKRTYSSADLDSKLHELEFRLLNKSGFNG